MARFSFVVGNRMLCDCQIMSYWKLGHPVLVVVAELLPRSWTHTYAKNVLVARQLMRPVRTAIPMNSAAHFKTESMMLKLLTTPSCYGGRHDGWRRVRTTQLP